MLKILSLGAGVQSSTIFLMSCFGELEKLDHAIFADTGWESKKVYEWFYYLKNFGDKHGIPIHIVSNGNIKLDAINNQIRGSKLPDGTGRFASMPYYTKNIQTGDKGIVRRMCTSEYKVLPLERKARELSGYKKGDRIPIGTVEVWKGISTDEMQRANMSKTRWIEFYYPLIEKRMSRSDCLQWFSKNKLPTPPRSSCLGCPFHSNNEWRKIKKESQEEWEEVVDFDKKIRKCGGMRGEMFLHNSCVPLDEVDLRTKEDFGQLNFGSIFKEECNGVCGV